MQDMRAKQIGQWVLVSSTDLITYASAAKSMNAVVPGCNTFDMDYNSADIASKHCRLRIEL